MTEHIHGIAKDVSRLIESAEVTTDQALIAIANLVAGTTQARLDSGLTAKEGRATILRLQRALDAVISAGNHVVRAHGDCFDRYVELASGDVHPTTEYITQARARDAAARARRIEEDQPVVFA